MRPWNGKPGEEIWRGQREEREGRRTLRVGKKDLQDSKVSMWSSKARTKDNIFRGSGRGEGGGKEKKGKWVGIKIRLEAN